MNMKTKRLLAHSARSDGEEDQYVRHITGTVEKTKLNCEKMLEYADSPPTDFLENLMAAATFHDLGKLDDDNQAILRGVEKGRLPWDHIDAGVAHLKKIAPCAAWLVRGHHAPGLPSRPLHFGGVGRKLRGRRHDVATNDSRERHELQIQRTDLQLEEYLRLHNSVVGDFIPPESKSGKHGLEMRLALSCLVDADHADTCFFDSGELPEEPVEPRWKERLARLVEHISELPLGKDESERARNKTRGNFFNACLNNSTAGKFFSCEGPVGIGKTTSVTAFLLKLAIRDELRRIIIVAPYTNILIQTAKTLRKALVLPDESQIADQVIVEQHHRADFTNRSARSLASLWNAPIVLTTAVSFFETLSSRNPGALRKLHYLPGSAIFLDEAHAAIPVHLWPQNWKWLNQLADNWRCRSVFASGTLTKFWEDDEIVPTPNQLPELLPADQKKAVLKSEKRRVSYESLNDSHVMNIKTLCKAVTASKGPRLVILNTVQNAAVVAKFLKDELSHDVYHISTALTPNDRAKIYDAIELKLSRKTDVDWTLVATSCVEAGVDFSFRTAFRERFSVSSVLQVGGRVNRNSEFNEDGGAIVYSFELSDKDTTSHPAAKSSSRILLNMLSDGSLNSLPPSEAATIAMKAELDERGGLGKDLLLQAESSRDYPKAQELGRVIVAETQLVVVDETLKNMLNNREKVNYRELLNGSVQLWTTKIHKLGMEPFDHLPEIYKWNDAYDANFLGIMEGILTSKPFSKGGGVI